MKVDTNRRFFAWSAAVVVIIGFTVAGAALVSGAAPSPKDLYRQHVEQQRSADLAQPRASKTGHPRVAEAPPSRRVQGIFSVKQGPLPSDQFQVVNAWAGPVPGKGEMWYVVWAGSTGDFNAQPGVPGFILQSQSPTPDGRDFVETTLGMFLRPEADGPLRVNMVDGAVVTMSSPKGATIRFNVVTRQVV